MASHNVVIVAIQETLSAWPMRDAYGRDLLIA
jgi:hypothetical protein